MLKYLHLQFKLTEDRNDISNLRQSQHIYCPIGRMESSDSKGTKKAEFIQSLISVLGVHPKSSFARELSASVCLGSNLSPIFSVSPPIISAISLTE